MKKYLRQALIFLIYGLCAGVFYREFTKAFDYTSETTLGKVHPHILMLGFFGFLVIAMLLKTLNCKENKLLKIANILYCAGLVSTTIMMIVRGVLQVIGTELSKGANAGISGLAGIGHMVLATGLVLFAIAFLRSAREEK